MVATLQSRKEALEAKILEKNEELKKLCLQEADLTGIMPPEIPLEPGEPPPTIRRRVGTSFSFPQNLINNVKDADDESLTALELECKVQTNIAEAALALANDTSANKAARRKHRLMYRQSQRRLMELEARLNLLKQGKSQLKPQQIKKKPRPNTTAVENLGFLWNKNLGAGPHLGSWPGKLKQEYSLDDIDGRRDFDHETLANLHRFKSGASQSSGSSRTEESEEFKSPQLFNSGLPGFYSQDEANKMSPTHHKRNSKRMIRRQWDTQSAGGTLLPSQTYPDHSHQPNLSRTQSLGSMESNPQKSKDSWSIQDFSYEPNIPKEKEWYETSLDSAPSPPLRTTSRLPSTARMLYQMQEMQPKGVPLQQSNSHPALPTTPNTMHKNVVRSASAYPASDVESLMNSVQQMHLTKGMYQEDPVHYVNADYRHFPKPEIQPEPKPKTELPYDSRLMHEPGLPLIRHNSLTKYNNEDMVYVNIPKESPEMHWGNEEEFRKGGQIAVPQEYVPPKQVPSQPYYHSKTSPGEKIKNLQYQAARNRHASIAEEHPSSPIHHPPHAITQNEISFDTVVPFESPQNHTVVQAGKWQPYREVTKPFEMSDFYKYSTKFRQKNQNRANTPDVSRTSPSMHQKGVYTPLKPMTCRPVESRTQTTKEEESEKALVEVSPPEIV